MSEWIDVNDELPPLYEEVQLFVPELDGGEVVAWSVWQGSRIYSDGWIRAGTMEGVKPPFAVTHWQPLPPLPGTDAAPGEAELGRELIARAAQGPGLREFDGNYYCDYCGKPQPIYENELDRQWHADDCLHLRARALRGESE